MNTTTWLSKRLAHLKHTSTSSSTGAVIAVTGVALAAMVMLLSMAVSTGFKHEIERKIMGFDSQVTVLPPYDYNTMISEPAVHLSDTLSKVIASALPSGTRVVPMMRHHAILKSDSNFMAIECRAYAPAHDNSFERDMMTHGSLPSAASNDSIVISEVMARKLGLAVGDKTFLYFFADNQPKARRVYVGGLYLSNFGEYDDAVVYTPMSLLQGLSPADTTGYTSLQIEGLTKDDIIPVSATLQEALLSAVGNGTLPLVYPVNHVLNTGAVFFNWLDLLDTNVVVIFILMACVAAFTLISSLFIIILDRVPTIGLLRSLGASRSTVSNVFVLIALRLVGLGLVTGNALALGVIALQHATHFLHLDPQMYYLAYVPFELHWQVAAGINLGVITGAWLILILPARIASSIDPAATMRYE